MSWRGHAAAAVGWIVTPARRARSHVATRSSSRDEFVAAAARGQPDPRLSRAARRRRHAGLAPTPRSAGGEHSFLLESVVGGETWAAYSFVGVAPRAVVRWRGRQAQRHLVRRRRRRPAARRPSGRRRIRPPRSPRCSARCARSTCRACRASGAARSAGSRYDCVRAFEDLPARAQRAEARRPAAARAWSSPTRCVIFDNLRQTLKVVATPYVARPERAERRLRRARARASTRSSRTLRAPRRAAARRSSRRRIGETRRAALGGAAVVDFAHDDFLAAVDRVKEYILAGDAFQVVLSQRFSEPARRRVDPLDVYRALRVINPSPYMFHLEFPEARVTGASPETLVRLVGRPRRGAADRRHAAARQDRRRRRRGSPPSCSPIRRSAPSTSC